MSLTLNQLREKVKPLYPEVDQVGDTVLRYVREGKDSAFAVYYLDVGDELPHTQDKLRSYVNRVVGDNYFNGSSSLQWNNYLYFVRSRDQIQNKITRKAKEFIEKDREYARKFVINECELDSVLQPKVLESAGADQAVDTISPWVSIFQEAKLIEAVFGDHTLPRRMELIWHPPHDSSPATTLRKQSLATLLPPIREFEIVKSDREYPIQRKFHFGSVNLLYGANGTGKTSLLEAIELFYCGKTRRNPKVSEKYRFTAVVNDKPQSVGQYRTLQPLRDRNLAWYGVREERTTKLYDGFGRFNFLNSDAAIELSQSAGSIDGELARLLVGSEAAKTWQVIEKLGQEVGAELRGLTRLNNQVQQELRALNKQLKEISAIRKESDSFRSALSASLQRNEWVNSDSLHPDIDKLIAELADLHAVIELTPNLIWLDSPITLESIEGYIQAVDLVRKECVPHFENLKTLQFDKKQLAEAIQKEQEALGLINELKKLVKSGVEKLTLDLSKQREIISTHNRLSAGIDEESFEGLPTTESSLSASNFCAFATKTREQTEAALLQTRHEYDQFAQLRDRSESLSQELRATARQILKQWPSDECPLCHTRFKPGELAQHISVGIDTDLEETAQELLKKIEVAEANTKSTVTTEKTAKLIESLLHRMKLPPETLVSDVITKLKESKAALKTAQQLVSSLTNQIDVLEEQNISVTRINKVISILNSSGIDLEDRTTRTISSLSGRMEKRLTESKQMMNANTKEEERLQACVGQIINNIYVTDSDPLTMMVELNQQAEETRAIRAKLNEFLPRYKWNKTKSITEWSVEVETALKVAIQLQSALDKEKLKATTRSDAEKRREKLEQRKKTLADQTDRCSVAQKALKEIQTNHSLKAITDSALQANRESIETVFNQIHSPAEFGGINKDWALTRKLNGAKTPLTMISTGQRAAFALAVFLAQNAQLRVGPRVILIDDPIAQVDDLNCLSFLDYLREIALQENRQIFFATASQKLANLFERKFDFLGDSFKKFNLTRDISS